MKKEELTRRHFISIVTVKNTILDDWTIIQTDGSRMADYKIILFHCLPHNEFARDEQGRELKAQRDDLVENTQFCIVGNYMIHRQRDRRYIWVTKLNLAQDEGIYQDDDESINKPKDRIKFYDSVKLDISALLFKQQQETIKQQVQMTEVPKAYFTTLKSTSGSKMEFYDNLI